MNGRAIALCLVLGGAVAGCQTGAVSPLRQDSCPMDRSPVGEFEPRSGGRRTADS
jgi:hypothetical protein